MPARKSVGRQRRLGSGSGPSRHVVWYQKNSDRKFRTNRIRLLRAQFGLTEEKYDRLLERQGGVCAICQRPQKKRVGEKRRHLSVDHNHVTGRLRGLLCGRCNTSLQFVEAHGKAIQRYLRRGRKV